MIDIALWWIGLATCAAGAVGMIAIVTSWSINRFVGLLGFTKRLTHAYGRYLQDKHAGLAG